jgi:DNA polymerase-1
MILTVHDELVFELAPEESDAAADLVTREMTQVCEMRVPLAVEMSLGDNWAEAKV